MVTVYNYCQMSLHFLIYLNPTFYNVLLLFFNNVKTVSKKVVTINKYLNILFHNVDFIVNF